ncbi:NAD(P)/FAD-dependent oxidoreductase [Xanthomonas sp. NCPPB 2654]|uniref:NAD(P)/FAD-dependent oxidoreductase n=1 Tax=unclassified Xanthomonas TaxID=2643310 RepID=UPI0021DF6D51|nr:MULTISPECIES: NAD(P)/FAD-dependent oxidoreductase [unclassified Xanthomonas]MDL5364254.1 NAD(P)/FAD-dependent oxidoreductase [Xanthomonas sp. NCPPB 2654]UYC20448.1 NAD(P)/FAD-dependent oxidoreductase [Xanthomonas sp. CFBP 8443]
MQHDAVIVGGSFAGLSAALMLARGHRKVLVVDAGLPRNRYAPHSHGLLALDGMPGSAVLAQARAQLLAYPTVEWWEGQVEDAKALPGGWEVALADGRQAHARGLVLATGVADQLPELPGVAERWGHSVMHCPYCHGYELGRQARIGVLGNGTTGSAEQALMLADWGQVTLFAQGMPLDDAELMAKLARRGVQVETRQAVALEGEGTAIDGMRVADGERVAIQALFLAAPMAMATPLAERLGCAFDDGPLGPYLRVDEKKSTSLPRVYAAGDAARMFGNATLASADGVLAGIGLHHTLIAEDSQLDTASSG